MDTHNYKVKMATSTNIDTEDMDKHTHTEDSNKRLFSCLSLMDKASSIMEGDSPAQKKKSNEMVSESLTLSDIKDFFDNILSKTGLDRFNEGTSNLEQNMQKGISMVNCRLDSFAQEMSDMKIRKALIHVREESKRL